MKEPADQDHYKVLGVAYNATTAHIKKAYHAAAKKHHPDKATPSKSARCTKAFQQLAAAYEVLSDSALREGYNTCYPVIKAQWDEYERHQKIRQTKRQQRTRFTQELVVLQSIKDDFKVHAHVLKDRSTFWSAEIDRQDANPINLTKSEDDVVAAYVHFVYHGEVQTELSEAVLDAAEVGNASTLVKAEHTFLAKLYVFGEQVRDDAFCDQVVTGLAATIDKRDANGGRTFPSCRVVTALYEGTEVGSPIRQMMIDIYAENAGAHWFPARAYDSFHPEFAYDLLRELMLQKNQCPPKGRFVDVASRWHKKR